MKESLLYCKYTKVEVRIDPMARDVTIIGQIVEVEDRTQIIVQDRIIEATDSEVIPEGRADRMIKGTTEMKDTVTITKITRNYNNGREGSLSNSRTRSGSRDNTNRDRIRNMEQLQQMLNMEDEGHRIQSSDEDSRSPLNL